MSHAHHAFAHFLDMANAWTLFVHAVPNLIDNNNDGIGQIGMFSVEKLLRFFDYLMI